MIKIPEKTNKNLDNKFGGKEGEKFRQKIQEK